MRTWAIEETGYKPQTTFWMDFTIADHFGAAAVTDTFKRAFKEWKGDYVFLTELVMVLNWKIGEHYEKRPYLAELYDSLWREAERYAINHLKGEEYDYFCRTTD